MDVVLNFLGNPWVVGIGTGAISGLSVNVISRFVWARKDNKEYKQKTNSANNEIIYSLRSIVAEATMPKKEVIEAIARATARKYEIKRESLMTLAEISDTLIKEVMDSNFLSHEQKENYTTKISSVVSPAAKRKRPKSLMVYEDAYYRYRRNMYFKYINYFSLITAAGMIILTAVTLNSEPAFFDTLFTTNNDLLPVLLATAAIPLFAILTLRDSSIINDIMNATYDITDRLLHPRKRK